MSKGLIKKLLCKPRHRSKRGWKKTKDKKTKEKEKTKDKKDKIRNSIRTFCFLN